MNTAMDVTVVAVRLGAVLYGMVRCHAVMSGMVFGMVA